MRISKVLLSRRLGFLLGVAFVMALGAACGGGVPQEAVDPYENVYRDGAGAGEGAPAPTVDLSSLTLVSREERQAMGTMVASAGVGAGEGEGAGAGDGTARPTLVYVPRVGATRPVSSLGRSDGNGDGESGAGAGDGPPRVGDGVAVVTATPEPTAAPVVYRLGPCEDAFWDLVADDRGLRGRWFDSQVPALISFLREKDREVDVEYMVSLDAGFRLARPDCVAQGWDPEYSYSAVCGGDTMAGRVVTSDSNYGEYDGTSMIGDRRKGKFVWNPTGQSGRFLMIQFDKLPFGESGGCWAGDLIRGLWYWQTEDGTSYGRVLPDNSYCEAGLMLLAEDLVRRGWNNPAWQVESQRYLEKNGEGCPRHNFMATGVHSEGCPVEGGTGVSQGRIVVNFYPKVLEVGDTVCWVAVPVDAGGYRWMGYDRYGEEVEIGGG